MKTLISVSKHQSSHLPSEVQFHPCVIFFLSDGVFMEDQSAETCSGQMLLTKKTSRFQAHRAEKLDIIDGVLIAWLNSPWHQIRQAAHWNVNLCWCDLCPSGLCMCECESYTACGHSLCWQSSRIIPLLALQRKMQNKYAGVIVSVFQLMWCTLISD